MNIGVIIQARSGSRRLPDKVLRPIAGKPMLLYLLERLSKGCPALPVVVATSTDARDVRIASLCAEHGYACYRGPLENVTARFVLVSEAYAFGAFVRISGDSPLLDPLLVARAVELFLANNCDLVTNVMPRTFPRGQSVEVVKSSSLARSLALMKDDEDLEHVTRYFYKNCKDFRILNFEAAADHHDVQFAVDELPDIQTVSAVIGKMTRPHWDYHLDELVGMYRWLRTETPDAANAA